VSLATLVNSWTATPVQLEALTSETRGLDGAVVSEVLSAAIARVATLGPAGSPVVATPFSARSLLHEVADAVTPVPEARLLAPVFRLLARLTRRDELRLRGAVVLSHNRGPGLSLSLARANGDPVDNLVIWADEYEPHYAPTASAQVDLTDRMVQLSTAAAVWTHFAVLRFRLPLRNEEFRAQLGTADWQSYAYLRTGARERWIPKPEARAQALFALAVDADPNNLPAQFNLALMEALKRENDRAANRLQLVHERLGETGIGRRTADNLLSDRTTLDIDPLRFQVSSLWASAAFSRYWDETRDDRNCKQHVKPSSNEKLLDVWARLTEDLTVLEAALAILEPGERVLNGSLRHSPLEVRHLRRMDRLRQRRDRRWQKGSLSHSDSEQLALRDFLGRLEPAMLLRWALMGLEIGREFGDYDALSQSTAHGPARLTRVALARGLHDWTRDGASRLSAETVVEHFRKMRGSLRGGARYELACYFAQVENIERSLEELEQSFALGENRVAWAENDPQLETVRETPQYRSLRERYAV
jgi:hypothetical protein